MKAYIVQDRREPMFSTIVFAETRGKARALAQYTDACEDIDFIDIRVLRIPVMDKFYSGKFEMDWNNMKDRIAMVRFGGFECSMEVVTPECQECPAKVWCNRYRDEKQYNERNI